jgi:hypothetical protein
MDKDASLTFRLPAKTREALQRAANESHRSLGSLATLVLEEWLSDQGHLPKPKPQRKPKRG